MRHWRVEYVRAERSKFNAVDKSPKASFGMCVSAFFWLGTMRCGGRAAVKTKDDDPCRYCGMRRMK